MRRRIEQMQSEVNEFMAYVKKELARGHRRLGAAPQHRAREVRARPISCARIRRGAVG